MIGDTLMDRFEVQQRLGGGGFGAVYRAWDSRLERHVAVKVVEVGGDTGRRILREAHAAAKLNHPGIVTLYELGSQEGVWFMVTELVEGGTLRERCAAGNLSDKEILEVGADLCDALAHAHEKGIVHRDVKPQNVLVPDSSTTAKLADFGIGRILEAAEIPMDGPLPGAMAYVSPEQAAGAAGGPQTDVYSLGLTLRECLAGRTSRGAWMSLARARPDLPERLIRAVDACLSPHPDDRPSPAELGDELEAAAEELAEGGAGKRAASRPASELSVAGVIAAAEPASVAFAAGLAGLIAAAAAASGLPGALPLLALAAVAAFISFVQPLRAVGVATAGVSAWLAIPAGRPGTALVLAAAAFSTVWLMRDTGRRIGLVPLAPILFGVGAGLAVPVLCALAENGRRRIAVCASGLVCTLLAERAVGRDLLPLVGSPAPPEGWQGSLGAALGDVVLPALVQPAFWGLAILCVAASAWLGARLRRPRRDLRRRRHTSAAPALRPLRAGGGRGGLVP